MHIVGPYMCTSVQDIKFLGSNLWPEGTSTDDDNNANNTNNDDDDARRTIHESNHELAFVPIESRIDTEIDIHTVFFLASTQATTVYCPRFRFQKSGL